MRYVRNISICLVFLFSSFHYAHAGVLTDQARSIYKKYNEAVLQIRVVSRETGEKAALGSGFQFRKDGLAATNYHVISGAALFPNLYYVEAVQYDGTTQRAEIINLDPVHDLAILQLSKPLDISFDLGNSEFDKGTKIFSFGNPYDLGMTIVEGLYNGLMEHAMYRKILFSGSLNPGMSGGPALGQDGKVLGVNVSTAGNQISFFVPIEYLKPLVEELKQGKNLKGKWKKVIKHRIVKNQDAFIKKLIDLPQWHKRLIGEASVPGEISEEFKCWGQSGNNKRYWVKYAYLACSTEDRIFVSSTMYTGSISFRYTWLKGRSFSPFRFYNLYGQYVDYDVFKFDNAAERDADNFDCDTDTVDINGKIFQASTCVREYDDYQSVYDVNVKFSSVSSFDKALTIEIVMLGVTQQQIRDFLKRFMSEISW